MADEWYYTQGTERKGPVSSAKLKQMADEGWMTPKDLVWKDGLANWMPAGEVRGLFGNALAQKLREGVDGAVAPTEGVGLPTASHGTGQDPSGPAARPTPKSAAVGPEFDLSNLKPRHLLAGCGAFVAALGIAFTAIAHSQLSLAFTLGGLALAATGMYVEVGALLGQAIENIGKASREASMRRQEAKKLALEKQRLDLEEKRLAHEQAVLQQAGSPGTMPVAPQVAPVSPQPSGGSVVVVTESPVQRWSPGLAAVLSLFVPGLGQLYKGQIIRAVLWFLFVGMGYLALIVPGLVLHFFCVVGALSGNPWTAGKTTVVRS
jgi:TM2 domain-containing membrane protein YozV